MQSHELLKPVRDEYFECCLTNNYQENHCRIDLTGLDQSTLVTIHGDQNQRCSKHRRTGRLCDRLIFGYLGKEFICAAELKGGKNPEVPKAVRQIQGGLDLARELLDNRTQGDWYPLLFFSGKMKGNDLRTLSTKTVSFGGKKKRVVRIDCGGSLRKMLTNDTRRTFRPFAGAGLPA